MNILLVGKFGKKGMNEAIKHCDNAVCYQRFDGKNGQFWNRGNNEFN